MVLPGSQPATRGAILYCLPANAQGQVGEVLDIGSEVRPLRRSGRGPFRLELAIELGPEGGHLPSLEVGDLDRPPAFGGTGHSRQRELQNSLLPEGVGDDPEPPAFLEEQAFKKVGRSRSSTVGDR